MPRRLTIRNRETGESMRIDWEGAGLPSKNDIDQMFTERREKSKAAVQKSATEPLKLSRFQSFAASPLGEKLAGAIESFDPVTNIGKLGEGLYRSISGKRLPEDVMGAVAGPSVAPGYQTERALEKVKPPEYPRIAGAAEATSGALGLGSVAIPSIAARQPVATAVGAGAFEAGRRGTEAALENVGAPPEVTELASDIVGAGAGGLAGSRFLRSPVKPPGEISGLPVRGRTIDVRPSAGVSAEVEELPLLTRERKMPQAGFFEELPGPGVKAAGPLPQIPGQVRALPAPPAPVEVGDIGPGAAQIEAPPERPLLPGPVKPPAYLMPGEIQKALPAPDREVFYGPPPAGYAGENLPAVRPPGEIPSRRYAGPIPWSGASEATMEGEERLPAVRPPETAPITQPTPQLEAPLEEVPETAKEVPTEGAVPPKEEVNPVDEYFNTLQSYEDAKLPTDRKNVIPSIIERARALAIKPSALEEDLRLYDVPEDEIDNILKETYGDVLEADIKKTPITKAPPKGKVIKKTKEKGALTLQVPTGVVSKLAHKLEGSVSSADQFLEKQLATAPVAKVIKQAHFDKEQWKVNILDQFARAAKGFKGNWEDVTDYMDGVHHEGVMDPQVQRVGQAWRQIFDNLHKFMQDQGVTARSGAPVGYLKDYISHIIKDDTFGDVIKDSFSHIFGEGKEAKAGKRLFGSEEVPLGEHGEEVYERSQVPRSPYVEPRRGTEKLLERDPRIIIRRYVDSVGRLVFDKPAVLEARERISKLPESFDKDLATWYVQHYSKLDMGSEVGRFFKTLDRKAARVGARSVLFGSTKLQTLHLARVAAQIWPELGTKYTFKALTEAIEHPLKLHKQAKMAGLLPQSSIPRMFMTKTEIFDKIGNYADFGNSAAKIIALEGNRQKLADSGIPNWEEQAVYEAARQEGFVHPASPSYVLEVIPKFFVQFKYWLQKYGENFARASAEAWMKKDAESWGKIGRYLIAGTTLQALTVSTGISLWHVRGRYLAKFGSPQQTAISNIGQYLSEGKYDKALDEILKMMPGGAYLMSKKKKED